MSKNKTLFGIGTSLASNDKVDVFRTICINSDSGDFKTVLKNYKKAIKTLEK